MCITYELRRCEIYILQNVFCVQLGRGKAVKIYESPLIELMGYEWKTEGKNYLVSLQRCSKLIKKINTKLYLMRLILTLRNFIFTLAVLDSNCNILMLYIYCILIHIFNAGHLLPYYVLVLNISPANFCV